VSIPTTLGPYRLLDRQVNSIGSHYHEAVHEPSQAKVVLNLVPNVRNGGGEWSLFSRADLRSAMTIHHPHIHRVYGIEQEGGMQFVVMEHISGHGLQDLVRREGRFSDVRACDCIRQAAMALQCIHEKGWAHGDIEPDNLIVCRTGTVKVHDLGPGRFYHDEELILTKKYDESVLGTADYMAPESVLDVDTRDIRADIYSLGCVFYFVLTGRPPFPEGTVAEKLIWHQTRNPKPIPHFRSDVPPAVVSIVDRMMAKDRARRFQTPAEMVDALDSLPKRAEEPPPRINWPTTVVELARSFEAGEDCAFALHDALTEAGEAEVAEHFRGPWPHPKDCWAVQRILHPIRPRRPVYDPAEVARGPVGWLRSLLGLG
jgi:eukaryotic-like serine/threonine-protein kinase